MATTPLTAKEQRFVQRYLVHFIGARAATEAGYSARSAAQIASRLLRKDNIRAALAAGQTAQHQRTLIDQDWVLERLVRNAERAAQAEPVRDEDGNPTGEYTYQGAVVNKALEIIGRHTGGFSEKHVHSFDDLPDAERAARAAALFDRARARRDGRAVGVGVPGAAGAAPRVR